MKILHISTFDRGGAATACLRLHHSLQKNGVGSKVLVLKASRNNSGIFQFTKRTPRFRARINRLLYVFQLRVHPYRSNRQSFQEDVKCRLPSGVEYFSFPDSEFDITTSQFYKDADIIHLHWVSGFLDYPSFFKKNQKPVIWTLHDMEPFQGGVHYEEKFFGLDELGRPKPFFIPKELERLIEDNIRIKTGSLEGIKNVTIVAPSRWLMHTSKNSLLFNRFNHYHIPYGLNTQLFQPRDKNFSKALLDIPSGIPCLLFVADKIETYRKGFEFLRLALEGFEQGSFILCAIGSNETRFMNTNMRLVGRIEDERLMSVVYSAADAFIIPSIEDNLPNTVLESLLCGTPVIGFRTGGIPDMINDGFNGLLCDNLSVNSLRETIARFLDRHEAFNAEHIRANAVSKYDEGVQAKSYTHLYNQLV